jgi:hypothetical protein
VLREETRRLRDGLALAASLPRGEPFVAADASGDGAAGEVGSTHRPGNNSMRGQGGTPVSLLLSWLTTRSTAFAAIMS